MSGAIGYLEAWSLWFSGQEVDKQLYMGPMTVLWWARISKIAAFVGGATAILDAIGPERLREWARHPRHPHADLTENFPVLAGATLALMILITFTLYMLGYIGPAGTYFGMLGAILFTAALSNRFFLIAANVLARPRFERFIRWVSIILLLLGFHFDLLAS